jgi:putative oxidoreductase
MSTAIETAETRAIPQASLLVRPVQAARLFSRGLSTLAPFGDLVIRLWVANVFWKSGLTKIQSFDTTLQLFRYEYSVPVLPPDVAAYLATASELGFSVLLALGLAGRLGAAGLSVINIVAVISYPALSEAGLNQHQLWGLLLLVPLLHGPGKLSLDHLIGKRFGL